MTIDEKITVLEAILFASGEPIEGDRIAESGDIEAELLDKLVDLLNEKYENTKSALVILKLNSFYQLTTRKEYSEYIKKSLETKNNVKLSQAAFEVLTIIAYNQPVTKGFVEHVRGVDSSSVVNSLVEKKLLEEAGRIDVPGRPIAFKTTNNFLRCFSLSSLDDLPPLPNQERQVSFDDILQNETSNDSDNENQELETTENANNIDSTLDKRD